MMTKGNGYRVHVCIAPCEPIKRYARTAQVANPRDPNPGPEARGLSRRRALTGSPANTR